MRRVIDPPLARLAGALASGRLDANTVTLAGFGLGLLAIAAIAGGLYLAGLVLFLANRVADGLDGALARRSGPSDLGGYLDIVLDFIVYAGMVMGFALAEPESNALAAAFLIFSFVGTASSFLAFAVMAAKRRMETEVRGRKSLYYLGGLTEGTETVALFVLCCLFPGAFVWLAVIYGAMCWLTTLGRVLTAWRTLG